MANLAGLIERVRAATGPDRELDALILAALDPRAFIDVGHAPGTYWVKLHGGVESIYTADRLTASLDAALALVERVRPGWSWTIAQVDGEPSYAFLGHPIGRVRAHGNTPALALIAALLAAINQTETEA